MKLGVVALLQTLAVACLLASAQRVHGAEAASKHTRAPLNTTAQSTQGVANATLSVVASKALDLTSVWAENSINTNDTRGFHRNQTEQDERKADKQKKPFLGGRHNESIPALGDFKQTVALLLQATEDETEQLQGCITIPIAPRFFLTRASCVRNANDAKFLFIETSTKSGNCDRHPVRIKTTTSHEDPNVNLAIVEVEDQSTKASPNFAAMLRPMPLADFVPSYYDRVDLLSLVSIDNIFNPSLAKNPRSIEKLIRVSPSSCQFGSSDDIAKCYVPAELSSRELAFEFGQGMLMYDKTALVGLPDCEGLCSGGMFYSATHLGKFRAWIDKTTHSNTKWVEIKKGPGMRRKVVTIEKEPSYVSLFTSSSPEAEPVCGGSLVAPRYVLTTASCVANRTITTARVSHGVRSIDARDQEDVIPARKVTIHPQFANTTKFSNDLAVIELAGPTFYMPTILASSDTLNNDNVHAVGTSQPRRSGFDSSIMCLPSQTSRERLSGRALQSTEDPDVGDPSPSDFIAFSPADIDVDVPAPLESEQPELSTVEQWNMEAGDGVLEVPEEASYYLLGVSLGLRDSTIQVGNHSEARLCSLNETVGDDDDSSLVVRLATPETIDFINSVSVDHTWNNPHELPFESSKFMMMDASFKVAKFGAFSINNSYSGPLEFDTPPSDMDLGFVVGLRLDREGQNYCGGSLIAPSYVLTAAHCVGGERAKFVSVGSRDSAGAEAELIAVKSTNVITHPLYGKRSLYSYDVAVLELESQAYPKPITLDNSLELNPSMYMTLYGYGADSATSTVLSSVLRSVDLPYFARDKCKTMFPELDESMFCAGGELARDACTGDSGSPLVRIVQGKPLLVGVVSSGRNGCGTPGVPGVYAFVAEMQSFIDKVVAGTKWVNAATSSQFKVSSVDKPTSTPSPEDENRGSSAGVGSPVLRSGTVNMTDLPFEIINMANGSMEHQLSIVELAKDTPSRLQVAVMDFLVGSYEYISGWSPKMDQVWTMSFYSTGDLTGLMQIIAQHKAKALYARKSRFVRPAATSQRGSDDRALLSRASCSDGH